MPWITYAQINRLVGSMTRRNNARWWTLKILIISCDIYEGSCVLRVIELYSECEILYLSVNINVL